MTRRQATVCAVAYFLTVASAWAQDVGSPSSGGFSDSSSSSAGNLPASPASDRSTDLSVSGFDFGRFGTPSTTPSVSADPRTSTNLIDPTAAFGTGGAFGGVSGLDAFGYLPPTRPTGSGARLRISESIRLDDNAGRFIDGAPVPPGQSRSDLYALTNLFFNGRKQVEQQSLFLNASYGTTNYLKNTYLDTDRYLINPGIDWRFGTTCAGTLQGGIERTSLPFEETLLDAVNVNREGNFVDLRSRCSVTAHYAVIFGAGYRTNIFTGGRQSLNNSEQVFGQAGLEYAPTSRSAIGTSVTTTSIDFSNRTAASGLASGVDQYNYQVYYRHTISPKTQINLSGGLTEIVAPSIGGGTRPLIDGTYNVSATWRPTPKITLGVFASSQVGAPIGIVADFQRTELVGLTLGYRYSPKLTISAAITQNAFEAGTVSGAQVGTITGSRRTNTLIASTEANYRITPFMFGTLGYRYVEQTVAAGTRTSNIVTFGLSYQR